MATIGIAGVLAIVGAGAAVAGAVQQRKIGKAQRKQNRISNRIAAIARQRAIRRSIASRRIAVGQAQAAGFNLGVAGGTAVQGAVGGLVQDTASAIGASNLQTAGSGFIASLQDRISGFQQSAASFGAFSNLAGGLSQNPQGVAALTSIFG